MLKTIKIPIIAPSILVDVVYPCLLSINNLHVCIIKKCFNISLYLKKYTLPVSSRTLSLLSVPYNESKYSLTLEKHSKGKGKAVCGSYSTAALKHIVLLPE